MGTHCRNNVFRFLFMLAALLLLSSASFIAPIASASQEGGDESLYEITLDFGDIAGDCDVYLAFPEGSDAIDSSDRSFRGGIAGERLKRKADDILAERDRVLIDGQEHVLSYIGCPTEDVSVEFSSDSEWGRDMKVIVARRDIPNSIAVGNCSDMEYGDVSYISHRDGETAKYRADLLMDCSKTERVEAVDDGALSLTSVPMAKPGLFEKVEWYQYAFLIGIVVVCVVTAVILVIANPSPRRKRRDAEEAAPTSDAANMQ